MCMCVFGGGLWDVSAKPISMSEPASPNLVTLN